MTEGLAFGFGVFFASAVICVVVEVLARMTKPRPVKAPARLDYRRAWTYQPMTEAELVGGPSDGARVSIPAYHPPHVMHNGERYAAYCEGIYRHDPTTHLTRRGY